MLVSGTLSPDASGLYEPDGVVQLHTCWKHPTCAYWLAYDPSYSTYYLSDVRDPHVGSPSAVWGADSTREDPRGTYTPVAGATGTATVSVP